MTGRQVTGRGTLFLLAAWAAAMPAHAADRMIWKGPAVKNWREVEQVTLSGTLEAGTFHPVSIAPAQPPASPVPMLVPIGEELLPLADIRPFGREERVEIHRVGHQTIIRCRPGQAPAGVLLDWPDRRWPRSFGGLWRLDGQAGANMGISAVRPGEDAPAPPAATWIGGPLTLPVAAGADQRLVLICPATGASARLDTVTLMPASDRLPDARGSWIWREQDWRADPSGFVRRAAAAGWTELAIQAPARPDAALTHLAAALADQGITFRLLDGDPAMATPDGIGGAMARFAQLRRWCEDHLAVRPVLELDIEPYAHPGFAADPSAGWHAWAEAVRAIAGFWGGAVAVDLPWWMRRSPMASAALEKASPSIAEIIVMAYRTDPQLILDAAEGWLAGAGPPVRIAIETGQVAAEATRTYRRAASGTLRLSDAGAELLGEDAPADPSGAFFALMEESRTDPARISFHGALSRAGEVERTIRPLLAGWPRFAGFRAHGWDATQEKPHG